MIRSRFRLFAVLVIAVVSAISVPAGASVSMAYQPSYDIPLLITSVDSRVPVTQGKIMGVVFQSESYTAKRVKVSSTTKPVGQKVARRLTAEGGTFG